MCASTVSVLADVSPSRISTMARVNDTLYIGAYDYNQITGDSNTRVVIYDLTTGMPVGAAIPFSSRPTIWPGEDEVWATDFGAGSIWRLRPGMSPEQVVSERPRPGAVISEGDYVYWNESAPPDPDQTVVKRQLIASGDVEDVTACETAEDLHIIGDDIYCAEFYGDVKRAPKAGGATVTIPSPGNYPLASMARDGSDLFFVTLKPGAEIFHVPTPDGPAELVMELTQLGRFTGIAATPDFIYLVGDPGVLRIHRTTNVLEEIYDGVCERDPLIWNDRLVFVKSDSQVLWCVDSAP